MNREELLNAFIKGDFYKFTHDQLIILSDIIQKDGIIKLVPASTRHSVPIYVPKKWEGSRVLIIKL